MKRTCLITVLLLPVLSWILRAVPVYAMGEAEIVDLFTQGKELFHRANELAGEDPEQARALYRKAAMHFDRIVRDGDVHNGKLYYNIGNAYFRMNDVGRAILNYRRAEQYIPNDPNLHQNLQYARARRLDQVEEKQRTRILKTLFFWHYDLPTAVKCVIFSVFFVTLWLAAAVRLFRPRPYAAWCAGISAAAALLFLGSLFVDMAAGNMFRPGVIVAPEIIARKGDSETYERSFKEPLHAGTECNLIENRGTWYHVELVNGRRCWVPAKGVEFIR